MIVNLGTPGQPSVPDVRKYLRQFLMDEARDRYSVSEPLVPDQSDHCAIPRAQICEGLQATLAPDGSPLKTYGYSVKDKLQKVLGEDYIVELAMRYQNPSIEKAPLKHCARNALPRLSSSHFSPQYASSFYRLGV